MLQALGTRYANDTNLIYVHAISGTMVHLLLSKDINGNDFWVTYNYNPDTVVARMKEVLDVYMAVFPNTPVMEFVDQISFEPSASGNPKLYVATQYSNYGIATYPDRLGVWKDNLGPCTNLASTTSGWGILASNPCRNGAQPISSVNDTARMNKCGITPNTNLTILDSMMKKGLSIGMLYYEIYEGDVNNASLSTMLQIYHDSIMSRHASQCAATTDINEIQNSSALFTVYPNPSNATITIQFSGAINENTSVNIYNSLGQLVISRNDLVKTKSLTIDINDLPEGFYFVQLNRTGKILAQKIIINY